LNHRNSSRTKNVITAVIGQHNPLHLQSPLSGADSSVVRIMQTATVHADKSGSAWKGSAVHISKLLWQDRLLVVDAEMMSWSDVLDLGVLLDSELSMKQHITNIAAVCFYQLHRLYTSDPLFSWETLVLAIITSRLDYCNSVLADLPRSMTEQLQSAKRRGATYLLTHSCLSYSVAHGRG